MAFTTVNKGTDYFQTKIYTGNASNNPITGVGFKPDLVWAKKNTTGNEHTLADVVRGSNKVVYTNLTNAEQDKLTSGIISFDTNGFTLGGASGDYNDNGVTYTSFNWLGGGTAVTNNDGDVTSTVSANQTSGFSIVKYTNPSSGSPFTVGHGLNSPPKMIIIKNLSSAQNWGVWHTSIGFGNYLILNSDTTTGVANLVTATSSTTFSTYQNHHSTGNELIAYCFAEVQGFSKFGSYIGNGNANNFVYTGFKPSWVMVKNTSSTDSWVLSNGVTNPYNWVSKYFLPNSSVGEGTVADLRVFNSNGFDHLNASQNASGNTFIYMAFAEHPLVSSTGTPCTAR